MTRKELKALAASVGRCDRCNQARPLRPSGVCKQCAAVINLFYQPEKKHV